MVKFWIFRGKGEFFLAVLAVSIPSYYGYTIYKESKFKSPIIDHTISLLARNPDVKQVLGSPLHYKSSTGSDYRVEDKFAYYSFKVGGPRGNLPVEVSASAMELANVYNPPFLEEKIRQIEKLKSELSDLQSLPKNQQTNSKISSLQSNIQILDKEVSETKKDLMNKFYIVEGSNMEALIENRSQDTDVPEDWKVWSISNLQLNLPNGNKVIVVPSEIPQVVPQNPTRLTYRKAYEKLNELPQNLTEQQKQEYTKQRSQSIYNKYNTHRLVTFLFLGCAAAGALWYKSKYTLAPINNTTLSYLAKTKFSTNTQIPKLGKYFVTNSIEGGRKGSTVDAKIKVQGPKKGYIHVVARYQQDGSYKPQSIQFVIQNQDGSVQRRINLK